MSDLAIRVTNLGKRYHIGERDNHRTLRDVVANSFKYPVQIARSWLNQEERLQAAKNTIWALRDVSFDVNQGETVGIIGRNGAGKSTLLKILSRITEPTTGRVEGYGRVGSLLEVGTGFHPELTGRENIYLNGAILGMTRTEINRKFDEIVAFSEVEKFLDTPVKRYSSGMYVRLAFAVAAHLEPEILIVDEVLAVGDVAFQKKCLGKMGDVAQQGRTVLFVSHNMAAVQTLCDRGIYLKAGVIEQDDEMNQVINTYLKSLEYISSQSLSDRTERTGLGLTRLHRVEICTDDTATSNTLAVGRPARFEFHITKILPNLSCVFTIYTDTGQPVTYFDSSIQASDEARHMTSEPKLICHLEELPLLPGRYRINVAISSNEQLQDYVEGATTFDVEPGVLYGRPIAHGMGYGSVSLPHKWTHAE